MTSITISNHDRGMLAGVGGAAVLGAGGVYAGVRIANSNIAKGFYTATGATLGGKMTSVSPFLARWIGATEAHAGKLGEFGAEHAGGVAHVAGKVAGGASDAGIARAAEVVTGLANKPELGGKVGSIATKVRSEAVGLVAADAVGNAAPNIARFAVPLAIGALGAVAGYLLLSNALD